jgi:hypothetical protein
VTRRADHWKGADLSKAPNRGIIGSEPSAIERMPVDIANRLLNDLNERRVAGGILMRISRSPVLAALGWVLLAGAAAAKPDHIAYNAVLYIERDVSSAPIARIPAGTLIDLVRRDKVWSMVSFDGKTGYLLSNLLVGGPDTHPGIPRGFYPSGGSTAAQRRVDPMPEGPYSYYFAGRYGYFGGLGALR